MIKQGLELKQQQKLSPLQIQTIKLIELPVQELEQRVRAELEDNPVLDDTPDPEKEPETEISRITFKYKLYSPVQPSDAEVLDYETIVTCPVNGTDMVLFEDDGGKTPDMEVIVDIPYDRDKYWEIGPEKNVFRRTLYLVKMFSVTPQAYDYLNPKINESLLFAGLVPPFISYGNVDGGYGLNAGMGCISSGWMENLVL